LGYEIILAGTYISYCKKHKSWCKLPSGHTSGGLLWHRPGPIFLHGVVFLI